MKWQDIGILIAIRKFGETDQIASFITQTHGLANGLIKGGISRKQKPYLQIGNTFDITWKSRLEEQLGFFTTDPIKILGATLFNNSKKLIILSCCCNMLYDCMDEKTPHNKLFDITDKLIKNIIESNDINQILFNYMLWEKTLLKEIGFALSLDKCNATGATENLCYISPKTGHAISKDAGEPYKKRLLNFPTIWQKDNMICIDNLCTNDINEALKILEYFFEKHIYSEKNKQLPYIRRNLGN